MLPLALQKEYAKLAELKKSVESTLREGRKLQDPKVNTELDNMKALYNKLGLQIANIRSSLEKGLSLATNMAEEMESLETWLRQAEEGDDNDLQFLRVS